jgi:hypothetical protein
MGKRRCRRVRATWVDAACASRNLAGTLNACLRALADRVHDTGAALGSLECAWMQVAGVATTVSATVVAPDFTDLHLPSAEAPLSGVTVLSSTQGQVQAASGTRVAMLQVCPCACK